MQAGKISAPNQKVDNFIFNVCSSQICYIQCLVVRGSAYVFRTGNISTNFSNCGLLSRFWEEMREIFQIKLFHTVCKRSADPPTLHPQRQQQQQN